MGILCVERKGTDRHALEDYKIKRSNSLIISAVGKKPLPRNAIKFENFHQN